jgi:hypothetical protein
MAELHRRTAMMGRGPIVDEVNPDKILERDSNPFFYDPEELNKILQPADGKSTF